MSAVPLIEYSDASPAVRAVYDDIMATRKSDWINNFWKALATTRRPSGAPGKASRSDGPGAIDPSVRS